MSFLSSSSPLVVLFSSSSLPSLVPSGPPLVLLLSSSRLSLARQRKANHDFDLKNVFEINAWGHPNIAKSIILEVGSWGHLEHSGSTWGYLGDIGCVLGTPLDHKLPKTMPKGRQKRAKSPKATPTRPQVEAKSRKNGWKNARRRWRRSRSDFRMIFESFLGRPTLDLATQGQCLVRVNPFSSEHPSRPESERKSLKNHSKIEPDRAEREARVHRKRPKACQKQSGGALKFGLAFLAHLGPSWEQSGSSGSPVDPRPPTQILI